jgi:uncharacterized protein (TIGR03382 family)
MKERLMLSAAGRLLLIPFAAAACAGEADLIVEENTSAVRSDSRFVSGLLTPASASAPETTVRGYLAANPALLRGAALEAAAVRRLASGSVITMRQRHGDLPVVGGAITARTDDAGRLRWLRSSAVGLSDHLEAKPALAAAEVTARLEAMPRFAGRSFAGARSSLVVFAVGAHAEAPRLAWQIDLVADLGRMEALQIHADASSSVVLSVVDRIQRASEHRARLFTLDPIATPELTEVTLDQLPAGAETLEDASFEVWNCLDRRECVEFSVGGEVADVHFCSFDKLAVPGPYGDFLALEPPADHTEFGDGFAEVQAYFHVRKALEFTRDRLGAPDLLSDVKFTVVANGMGQFMGEPAECVAGEVPADSQFAPLENAFFGPFHTIEGLPPPLDTPTMVFGQGAVGDFAYGGDVAYHEFGHGMFHFIGSREMGGKRVPDQLGLDPSPGGMDEGFADYLAIAISGEPVIGKYALGTAEGFRTAANQKTCPADLHGEEHDDSEPWSGALWSIRQGLAEDQRAGMDAAVLTTMMAITDSDDFKTVSEMLVTEIDMALGYQAAELASAELAARGFADECGNRTRVLAREDVHQRMFASEPGPSVLQFRVDVPAATDRLELNALAAQMAAGSTAPAATLHVKPGDQPIQWSWTGDAPTSDATIRAPITFTADEAQPGLFNMAAVATGDFAAGSYHLQIESADPVGLVFADLSSPSGADGKADDPGSSDSGGCSAAGGSAGGGVWLLLALAIAVRRRRSS